MRYLALFFVAIFVLFAVAQFNDPDPWLWVPIYLFPAVISFMVFRGRYPVAAIALGAIGFLIGAIYWLPPSMSAWIQAEQEAQSLQMGLPFIEEARESMGLLLCFIALVIYLIVYYTRRKAAYR